MKFPHMASPVWHCSGFLEPGYVEPGCRRRTLRGQRKETNRRKYLSTCLYYPVRVHQLSEPVNDVE